MAPTGSRRIAIGRDHGEIGTVSEYQYYEFQAVDRPLTVREMRELRAYSTRATITATRFVNHYDWGNFKGDPILWMENYFDAFLYVANPGTRWLMLRVPAEALDVRTARTYCKGKSPSASASVLARDGFVILSFGSEDDWSDDWDDDDSGWLASLITLRANILAGDRRALYLAWLRSVQQGETKANSAEPPVPPGLGRLTASLAAFADFLRIDRGLLEQAARRSMRVDQDANGRRKRRQEQSATPAALPPCRR
jgi:hypothetical protein